MLFPYGSTVGGFVVALVALTVLHSGQYCHRAFYIAHSDWPRDYLLTPKSSEPNGQGFLAGVTGVAVMIGRGACMGVVGALAAIPVAAALQLLVAELLFPKLDES